MNAFLSDMADKGITIRAERDGGMIGIILQNARATAKLTYDPNLGDLRNGLNLQNQWSAVQDQF